MFDFLKICGIGVLTILLSPFWLALLALYAVYTLGVFIFTLFKTIIIDLRNLCVKDKSKIVDPLGDLPEDYEAKRILAAQEAVFVSVERAYGASSEPPVLEAVVAERRETTVEVPPSFSPEELPNETIDNPYDSLTFREQEEEDIDFPEDQDKEVDE